MARNKNGTPHTLERKIHFYRADVGTDGGGKSLPFDPAMDRGRQQTFSGTSRTAEVPAGPFSAIVAGVSPAPTAGTAGVGIRLAATKNLDGFLRYQDLFSANQTVNAFGAGIRYCF